MEQRRSMTRRRFVEQTAAAGTLPLLAAASSAMAERSGAATEETLDRKLRIAIVGLGGRGRWIASLFKQHPGYEITAAVDYFEDTANKVGERLGVPSEKRFSGLSGYKRALDSRVDALVLEGIPEELARAVTREVPCPTFGIGAGPHCDGQVLVLHDLLGLTDSPPRFVRRYADLGTQIAVAVQRFQQDVRDGEFPSEAETYPSPEGLAAEIQERYGC